MREIVTEDLISKLRVTKRLSFTKKGLVSRSFTEIIPDEAIKQMLSNDDSLNIDIPDYVNYNKDLSSEAGGGTFVYDYEREYHNDGHEIICFNTFVETRFAYERLCNNIGIEEYFYVKQTLEDVTLYHINVHIRDPYSEGSVANVYIDDTIVAEIAMADTDVELGDEFNGVYCLEYPVGTVNKVDVVIVGNTNINARSEFTFTFDSYPEQFFDDEEVDDD